MAAPHVVAGCPSRSAIADGFDGSVIHLANDDVTLCAVSRAPIAKLQAYKQRMGWSRYLHDGGGPDGVLSDRAPDPCGERVGAPLLVVAEIVDVQSPLSTLL
ncbi:DUF899 domain-containing protein [Streptomyces lunaelactis]|uniref:DUF899 domain-containing protein n=1 Tax=Streptomyces lunaelactis TaxID=1535768 RepID=UPI00211D6409|nr:DUF899 domain-containing protein [Streptomyces lunaelactis]